MENGKKWMLIAKLLPLALICFYLGAFLFGNVNKPVKLWLWFGIEPDTTLMVALFLAFVAGIIVAGFCWAIWRYLTRRIPAEAAERPAGEATE